VTLGEYRLSMPQPPALSPEQRQAALAKAAAARRVRAEVKEQLKSGQLTLPQVIERAETDEFIAGIKVLAILESLPGVGKVKARRSLDEIGISENRRLRGLGENQRKQLLDTFGR